MARLTVQKSRRISTGHVGPFTRRPYLDRRFDKFLGILWKLDPVQSDDYGHSRDCTEDVS